VYVTIGSRNWGVRSVSYVREAGTAALTLEVAEVEEEVAELMETELLDDEGGEEEEEEEVDEVMLEVELCEDTVDEEDETVVVGGEVVVVVVACIVAAYRPPAAIIMIITITIPIMAPLLRACFILDFRDNILPVRFAGA
jgi:hypothetical protein